MMDLCLPLQSSHCRAGLWPSRLVHTGHFIVVGASCSNCVLRNAKAKLEATAMSGVQVSSRQNQSEPGRKRENSEARMNVGDHSHPETFFPLINGTASLSTNVNRCVPPCPLIGPPALTANNSELTKLGMVPI